MGHRSLEVRVELILGCEEVNWGHINAILNSIGLGVIVNGVTSHLAGVDLLLIEVRHDFKIHISLHCAEYLLSFSVLWLVHEE